MKYYVVEIAEGDKKIAGKGIYEFESRTEAIATFHSKLGVAMKSDLYTSEQILVVNSANGIEAQEVFIREVSVEEPVVEEPVVEE